MLFPFPTHPLAFHSENRPGDDAAGPSSCCAASLSVVLTSSCGSKTRGSCGEGVGGRGDGRGSGGQVRWGGAVRSRPDSRTAHLLDNPPPLPPGECPLFKPLVRVECRRQQHHPPIRASGRRRTGLHRRLPGVGGRSVVLSPRRGHRRWRRGRVTSAEGAVIPHAPSSSVDPQPSTP